MGVDLRRGKTDHFVRYKIYPRDYDIKNAIVSSDKSIGVFYAKDVSGYTSNLTTFNNRFARDTTRGVIETYDMIPVLESGTILYNMQYKTWWVVENYVEDSVNETEQNSTRPSARKEITIRKG